MPATLVPQEAIPGLAAQVNSPVLLRALELLERRGHIVNGGELDAETTAALKRLAMLELADAGYAGAPSEEPFLWVANGNGRRVLRHLEETQGGRYRVEMHPRAHTALSSLSPTERDVVQATAEALKAYEPAAWPHTQVYTPAGEKPVYVLQVDPDLRAFVAMPQPQVIELYDIVRKDTLEQFLQRARSKAG